MAEKVIKSNESLVPFFGEKLSFIRGLDPLGLQNVSDATFSQLLPGLNNVTGRIRYYSFYCWLLDLYSKENGSTDPQEQKQFIRRAEFMIALSSLYFKGDNASIPGSNYAKKEIDAKGITKHNLQEGTFKEDGSTPETYWNYSTGAFGQYYLGSLRDIGIVSNRDKHVGLYVRTNNKEGVVSGELLANAFEENISPVKKRLFINCLKNGCITEKQLKELLPDFDLTIMPPKSKESELLIRLLLQKDYPLRIEETPSTYRQQTIKHLLHFVKNNKRADFSDRIFVYDCYDNKGKQMGLTDECLRGWYYYQFNEFWHFANTSMLNGTLDYLETTVGPNWMPISQLVSDVTSGVIRSLIKSDLIKEEDSNVNELLSNLKNHTEYDCLNETLENLSIDKVANGFLLMLVLYSRNINQLIDLKEYSETNGLAKDGEGSDYFIKQFSSKGNLPINKFIYDYLYINIIYRHQYVAFRKIRGGVQSTQKFIIEDQHIRYLGNFEATFTGPRIGRLINFLIDLGIITESDKLSASGQVLLKELLEKND